MTKRELIQAIAAKAGLTNAQAEAALDAFGAVITEALVADKKIQLPGVFTASTAQRAEREGRNPSTGKAMTRDLPVLASAEPAGLGVDDAFASVSPTACRSRGRAAPRRRPVRSWPSVRA